MHHAYHIVQKGEQSLDATAAAAALQAPSSSSTGFVADAVRTARAAFERHFSLSRQRQSRHNNGESDAPDAVELKPLMADDVSTLLTDHCTNCTSSTFLFTCSVHARYWVLHCDGILQCSVRQLFVGISACTCMYCVLCVLPTAAFGCGVATMRHLSGCHTSISIATANCKVLVLKQIHVSMFGATQLQDEDDDVDGTSPLTSAQGTARVLV
jgi:hypothetical protein